MLPEWGVPGQPQPSATHHAALHQLSGGQVREDLQQHLGREAMHLAQGHIIFLIVHLLIVGYIHHSLLQAAGIAVSKGWFNQTAVIRYFMKFKKI